MPLLFAFLTLATNSPVLTVPITPFVEASSSQEVWMYALADCESMGSTTIKVLDTNGYYSYGKYQWQLSSWLKYKKQGATKQNILDEEMQDKITKYVLDTKGDDDWWTCGNLVSSKIGSYHSQ